MLKTLLASLFSSVLLLAQTTGTVTFAPPAPGSFTATANTVAVVVSGNAMPATGVSISIKLGAVTIPTYTIPLPANAAYTFDEHYNGDAVTVILQSSATGAVTWQAAATPSGGTAGSGSGSF